VAERSKALASSASIDFDAWVQIPPNAILRTETRTFFWIALNAITFTIRETFFWIAPRRWGVLCHKTHRVDGTRDLLKLECIANLTHQRWINVIKGLSKSSITSTSFGLILPCGPSLTNRSYLRDLSQRHCRSPNR
jgi:hypothetical protein